MRIPSRESLKSLATVAWVAWTIIATVGILFLVVELEMHHIYEHMFEEHMVDMASVPECAPAYERYKETTK